MTNPVELIPAGRDVPQAEQDMWLKGWGPKNVAIGMDEKRATEIVGWYGRKPPARCPALTDTAITAWIKSGALTPPIGHVNRTERIKHATGLFLAGLVCIIVAALVWAPQWGG